MMRRSMTLLWLIQEEFPTGLYGAIVQGEGSFTDVVIQKRHFGHSEGFHLLIGSRFLGGIGQVKIVMQGPELLVVAFKGCGASKRDGKPMSRVARIWWLVLLMAAMCTKWVGEGCD